MTELKLSKMDVARRQIDTALYLWFHDGDPISIYTLEWSAFQIIQDLVEKKGKDKSVLLEEIVKTKVKDEHVQDAMRLIKKPMTFFKHANRDPFEVLEFNTELAGIFTMFSIMGIGSLGERISDIQRVYTLWQMVHNPGAFTTPNILEESLRVEDIDNIRKMPKTEFLEAGLALVAQMRSKGAPI